MEQEYGSTAAVNNDSPSQEPTAASDNSMTVLMVEKKPLRFVIQEFFSTSIFTVYID
jgi:hypothetical protein